MRIDSLAISTGAIAAYRRSMAAVATAALVVVSLPVLAGASPAVAATWRDVVVTGSDADGAARAVRAAGGRVVTLLPVVRGVAAQLPLNSTLGAGWLEAPQREDLHEVADVQAGRGGVEPAVERDGPGGERVTQGVEVGGVGDQPAPLELVEDVVHKVSRR